MTFEQIQEATDKAADEIWMKVGNPQLPRDHVIALIRSKIFELIAKERGDRNEHLASMVETMNQARGDLDYAYKLMRDKDERIRMLETEIIDLKGKLER
jgi:hypothetical protein